MDGTGSGAKKKKKKKQRVPGWAGGRVGLAGLGVPGAASQFGGRCEADPLDQMMMSPQHQDFGRVPPHQHTHQACCILPWIVKYRKTKRKNKRKLVG